jgi:hypothetical protein
LLFDGRGPSGVYWRGCNRTGNFFVTFQFPDAELKQVDMNAGGTGSSELVYFELLRRPVRFVRVRRATRK